MTSKMLMRLFFRWVRQHGNGLGMVLGVGRGSVLTCHLCPALLSGSHIDPLAASTAS